MKLIILKIAFLMESLMEVCIKSFILYHNSFIYFFDSYRSVDSSRSNEETYGQLFSFIVIESNHYFSDSSTIS